MPCVVLQEVTTKYLNLPYTKCVDSTDYTMTNCQFVALQNNIYDVCQCVPDYIKDIRELIGKPNASSCNFYEHATCVSFIVQTFEPSTSNCLPRCQHSSVHQENIDVRKICLGSIRDMYHES